MNTELINTMIRRMNLFHGEILLFLSLICEEVVVLADEDQHDEWTSASMLNIRLVSLRTPYITINDTSTSCAHFRTVDCLVEPVAHPTVCQDP